VVDNGPYGVHRYSIINEKKILFHSWHIGLCSFSIIIYNAFTLQEFQLHRRQFQPGYPWGSRHSQCIR
jgi:hypothetical protein